MNDTPGTAVGVRLRQLRQARGQSLREQAREIGVSASSLSELERGVSGISLGRLQVVATHLGVSVAELLDPDHDRPRTTEPLEIIAPEDLEHGSIARGRGVHYALLGDSRGHTLQPYRITFGPGAGYAGDPIRHPGEEFTYVVFGGVVLHLGDDEHLLTDGMAVRFDSNLPHAFTNANAHSVAVIIGAGTPPW